MLRRFSVHRRGHRAAARPGVLLAASAATALLCGQPGPARGDSPAPPASALHEPARLTAGSSNQWMGTVSPSGDALYFVSDRDATAEIYVQAPVDAGPRLLFDLSADVSWPRPSPDGKFLAFISYRADATGDLCVRPLGSSKGSKERCYTGLGSAEVQPVWLDGGRRVGALMRTALHGNYQLRSFALSGGSGDGGTLVLERNMLGVEISPDGRWLAYVPLERTRTDVGVAFANHSGRGVLVQRLDGEKTSGAAIPFVPDLPGMTGFPAFSRDGRHLYFTQYLNDTNGDGAIDGNDNSVLFRVAFDSVARNPLADGFPEQLTSNEWSCRYPAPATDRLIVTCAYQGSLDIYALPLGGAVPGEWSAERVGRELHVARNHWTKLLLLARLLGLVKTPADKIAALREMVWLHIELREYESALYYSKEIAKLASGPGDPAAHWAEIMHDLIDHRREDVKLTHGQLSDRYVATESKRATALAGRIEELGAGASDVATLGKLVLAEIWDDLGRKGPAEDTFVAIDRKSIRDPLVLDVYAQRARAIYALRGDREKLLAVYGELAAHPAFHTLDRLRFAESFVEELLRGVARADRAALVKTWTARLDPASELSLMVQVAGWLLELDSASEEEVRAGIFELYKANRDPDRRRALVLATVRTAARLGNEYLQYQFATSWASWLSRAEPERKYAEDLYRQIVLERAYNGLAKGAVADARASFYAGTVQTLSLEAHIGFIEARLREGGKDVAEGYATRYQKTPDDPSYLFVRAYLLARDLPALRKNKSALDKTVSEAIGLLRRVAVTWPRSMEVHHVWGTVLHQRALRTGSRDDALGAHSHYLLALDLARDNVRFRAALLYQIGLLQAALGNHRVALRHFTERDRLPHVRPLAELDFRLAMARSAFHASSYEVAVSQAEQALAMASEPGKLARFRPLALDRLALYHLAAGQFDRALARYRELVPIVEAAGVPGNRVKARLGLVSAALGQKQFDLAIAEIPAIEKVLGQGQELGLAPGGPSLGPGADVRMDRRDYQILVAGLLAQAERGKGNLAAAARAMERRRDLLARRIAELETDPDVLELARSYYHLAEYAFRQGDRVQARQDLERGLAASMDYNKRTGSGVNEVGLRLLQAYAELHLYGGVDLASYALDLHEQLRVAYEFICKNPSPTWEPDRFLFGLYLTMLEVAT